MKLIDNVMDKYDFSIRIYDEIETFREWDDPQFFYPYGNRSIQVAEFSFSTMTLDLSMESEDYESWYQLTNF